MIDHLAAPAGRPASPSPASRPVGKDAAATHLVAGEDTQMEDTQLPPWGGSPPGQERTRMAGPGPCTWDVGVGPPRKWLVPSSTPPATEGGRRGRGEFAHELQSPWAAEIACREWGLAIALKGSPRQAGRLRQLACSLRRVSPRLSAAASPAADRTPPKRTTSR